MDYDKLEKVFEMLSKSDYFASPIDMNRFLSYYFERGLGTAIPKTKEEVAKEYSDIFKECPGKIQENIIRVLKGSRNIFFKTAREIRMFYEEILKAEGLEKEKVVPYYADIIKEKATQSKKVLVDVNDHQITEKEKKNIEILGLTSGELADIFYTLVHDFDGRLMKETISEVRHKEDRYLNQLKRIRAWAKFSEMWVIEHHTNKILEKIEKWKETKRKS